MERSPEFKTGVAEQSVATAPNRTHLAPELGRMALTGAMNGSSAQAPTADNQVQDLYAQYTDHRQVEELGHLATRSAGWELPGQEETRERRR